MTTEPAPRHLPTAPRRSPDSKDGGNCRANRSSAFLSQAADNLAADYTDPNKAGLCMFPPAPLAGAWLSGPPPLLPPALQINHVAHRLSFRGRVSQADHEGEPIAWVKNLFAVSA